jgi:uncharacterized protein (TIGR02391 family)
MVSINFHRYRDELQRILLDQAESLETEWDPFVAAWICYALSAEEMENNQSLTKLINRMQRWMKEDSDLWEIQRYLGPIAATIWLQRKMGHQEEESKIVELSEKVKQLNADDKWSPLRDPEQVYLLSLGLKTGNKEAQEHLKSIAYQELKRGSLRRKILFAAALRELGESITCPQGNPQDVGDVITLVWWAEKYEGSKKYECWKLFGNIQNRIALNPNNASIFQRNLTITEKALLYEAIVNETKYPEPTLLFEYLPLHPRIKQLTRNHFFDGDYSEAIFEAVKALNELIQQRTGITDKSEVELVQATMKKEPSKLIIIFNDFLNTKSGESEHYGLALICEGIFKAFRNPRGHVPKDHPLVKLDPYEALEQLATISYIMKRIESAKIERGDTSN